MNDITFDFLVTILKTLEDEDLKKTTIEQSLVNLLDKYTDKLTDEQKNIIFKKFIKYEAKRQENHNNKNKHAEEMDECKPPEESFYKF